MGTPCTSVLRRASVADQDPKKDKLKELQEAYQEYLEREAEIQERRYKQWFESGKFHG